MKQPTTLQIETFGNYSNAIGWAIAYKNDVLDEAPLWLKIAFLVFCAAMLYIWFRQHYSATKESITPAVSATTYLHLQVITGILLGAIWWPVAYHFGMMAPAPLWVTIGAALFCSVMTYVWFLQCRTPDKTGFIPKIW